MVGFWGGSTQRDTQILPNDAGSSSCVESPHSQDLGSAFLTVPFRYSLKNQTELQTLLPDGIPHAFGHSYVPIEVAPKAQNPQRSIDAQSKSGTSF